MRILVVAHSFPPDVSPRAIRWGALVDEWAALGHDVQVVSAADPRLAKEQRRGTVVVDRRAPDPARRLATSGAPGNGVAGALPPARRLLRRAWRSLYWPDAQCLWYPAARRRARLRAAAIEPDVVVSVTRPFTAHLVALSALGVCGEGTIWLADVGDPFSLGAHAAPNNRLLYGAVNRRAEASLLRRADLISVTTRGTRRLFEARFPGLRGRIEVIPPLLAPVAGADTSTVHAGPRDLVYAGSFYPGLRSPRYLLDVFGRMIASGVREYRLHILGDLTGMESELAVPDPVVRDHIHLHGIVSAEVARGMVASAHALVNVGNTSTYQLPSKLVEYAATGAAIVNFAPHEHDTSRAFLAGYPAFLDLVQSRDAPGTAAARLAEFLRNPPRPTAEEVASFIAPYRAPAVAERYLTAIRRVAGGSS